MSTLKLHDERMLQTSDSVFSLATIDEDSGVFFVGLENGTVEQYDLRTQNRVGRFDVQVKMITSLLVYRTLLCSASYDSSVVIWDLRKVTSKTQASFFGEEPIAVLRDHKEPCSSMTVVNNLLLTGARERFVKIWDLTDFKKITEIKQDQSPKQLLSFPSENRLFCLGDADFVQTWEIGENGSTIKRLPELQLHRDLITSACLSAQYFFTSSSDGWIDTYSRDLVKQYDTRTSCRLEQLKFANNYLFASREKGDIHVYKQT
eukprot:TRINITY_DN5554_c0_g1_i2.p1 TRINITY_DN5554_c0_g1~~TRINITY_DN5554_c0_g1_i2.p1  ORF type:complete len:261 (+),score=45.06 TRINITY_DN5554_c0_g1_i2:410-1192(+)